MTIDQKIQLQRDLDKLRSGGFTRINDSGHKIYLEHTLPFVNIEGLANHEADEDELARLREFKEQVCCALIELDPDSTPKDAVRVLNNVIKAVIKNT